MPKQLKYIGQNCQDFWYQNYKSDFQFFTLEDFIDNAGQTVASMYQKIYDAQYKELRADRKDEIVTFDPGMLSEQVLEVNNKDGIIAAALTQPIMTFMGDQNSAGVQLVYDTANNNELERTTFTELWQIKYMPKTNRIFFYLDINKINFVNKGDCNLKKVRVLYVPSMHPEAIIADTIADDVVQLTIMQMRQLADKTVVKKTLDNNDNALLETELDKAALK